jgi:hypothetical protein
MDSTSRHDEISSTQSSKEVTANALFQAMSVASWFGRRALTSNGLTWGSYGVDRWYINTTPTTKANFTQALTASGTRYFQVNRSLTTSEVTSAFDPDKLALYKVTTGTSTATPYEDHRDPHHLVRFLEGLATQAMGGSNKTLTYEQAMCETITLTGASGSLLDVIVPTTIVRTWTVYANTSGGGGIRVKTSAGTGITIADGMTAIVRSDGTNVLRVTADCPQ